MRQPLKPDLQPVVWPTFTEAQVSFLEKLYPPRCIRRQDKLEDHIRYAGAVELIEQMRTHTFGSPLSLAFTDDEEDALDDMAVDIAAQQKKE